MAHCQVPAVVCQSNSRDVVSKPDILTRTVFAGGMTALLTSAALLATPALAQNSGSQRLEDLIPDSAVANPEDWAQQGTGNSATPAEPARVPELAADAPITPNPQIVIDWPEPGSLPDIDPVQALAQPLELADFSERLAPIPEGSKERVTDELTIVFPTDTTLFPERDEFLDRFKSLSTVEELDDDDSIARLAAQSREDEELLGELLRTYGYFDAQVIRSVGAENGDDDGENTRENAGENAGVRFDVLPGVQYRVGDVDLGNLDAAGADYEMLRRAYQITKGDPLSLDAIENERFDLDRALGERGYPFAAIEEPKLLVDHAREEGDITMPVEPGGKYVLGDVTSSLPDFLSGTHLTRIARWDEGDVYQRSDEEDLRRAILATGLVGSITLTPVEVTPPQGDTPGIVDIAADISKAPLRTLAGSIGFGTEEGFRLEGRWEHRNLFPPEGLLRLRGIAGTQEQLAGVTFRKNNFKGRDRILSVDAYVSTIDFDAYDAETIALTGTFERVSTLLFQKPLSWSAGVELIATRESARDGAGNNIDPEETFFVAALPLYAQLDRSNDLLNPTDGWRLSGRVSPEFSESDVGQAVYVRNQFDASYYQAVAENVVLAGRVRLGSITGANIEEIAPSRRLYAGGGGSVRGYGFREIGPLSGLGDPLGGRSLAEFSLEARVRTGLFDGALGVVPFVDAGSVGIDSVPDFDRVQYGAGIGVRYHSGFGPFRVDVAFPLNPGPNDNWIAVYVALGQAF